MTHNGKQYPAQNTHCKIWYGAPSNEWFRIGWKVPKELEIVEEGKTIFENVYAPMDWEFWYQILPNANKKAKK